MWHETSFRVADKRKGGVMKRSVKGIMLLALVFVAGFASVKNVSAQSASHQAVPPWVKRGIPGSGHAALAPLVGSWRVELSIYGTMGRNPDLPPIVSQGHPHHSDLDR